jgi:hypothetical protein
LLSSNDIAKEAKDRKVSLVEMYDILDWYEKQLKEEFKTKKEQKKKNIREQERFLRSVVKASNTPIPKERDKVMKYFVNASFSIQTSYKDRNSGKFVRPTSNDHTRIFQINSTRKEIRDWLMNELTNQYTSEDSPSITTLNESSVKYSIERAEQYNQPRNIGNIPMRRSKVLKYDFMPEMAEITYKTTHMQCVIQCLADRYKTTRNGKEFTEESIRKDFASMCDYDILDGITPEMVLKWCKRHYISVYAFDIKQKLFMKWLSPHRNYQTLVFYAVDEHMYMIDNKKIIDSIRKKYADTNHTITNAITTYNEQEDLSKNPIYPFEDLQWVCQKTPIYSIVDYFEWIQAPSTVIVKSRNLYQIFKEIYKRGNIAKTYHKGKHSIQVIEYVRECDGKTIKIMKDPNEKGSTYLDCLNLCKSLGLTFTNQGMGTLIKNYYDQFRGRKSARTRIDRNEFFKCNPKCVVCGSTNELQIDHITPLANGGTNDIFNLQTLCKKCHFEKTVNERQDETYINIDPISSSFNKKVRKIFGSSHMRKFAFVEKLGDFDAKYGYDINKCRKNLLYYSNWEFPVYSVMDDTQPFDGVVKCGFYYIETSVYFPLRGHGWYSQPMVEYCLAQNIISESDIKYQLLPSLLLEQDYFKSFIDDVYSKFGDQSKLAINAFIGGFNRRPFESITSYYTSSYAEACYLYTQYDGSSAHYLDDIKAYQILFTEKYDVHETEKPFYCQVLDMEAVEAHKLSKIVGNVSWVKTDCVYSSNQVEISQYEWANGVPKYKYETPNITNIEMCKKLKNTKFCEDGTYQNKYVDKYIDVDDRWTNWKDDDDFDLLASRTHRLGSINIDGSAGTGKSTLIGHIKKLFDEKNINHVCLTPTNQAANIIGGQTICKFLGKHFSNMKYLKRVLFGDEKTGKKPLDAIIVDEISMVHEIYYKFFITLKRMKPLLRFIIVGDFKQLEPVKDRVQCDYKNSRALYELCNGNRINLTKCRRSDDTLFNICKKPMEVDTNTFTKDFTMRHICFTNKKRKEINDTCMKKFIRGKNHITIKPYVYDKNSQESKVAVGMPIIARINSNKHHICNNEVFNIESIDRKNNVINISNGEAIPIAIFSRLFHMAFATTAHKSQGATIREAFTIHEWNKMNERLRYVALSRATCIKNINII